MLHMIPEKGLRNIPQCTVAHACWWRSLPDSYKAATTHLSALDTETHGATHVPCHNQRGCLRGCEACRRTADVIAELEQGSKQQTAAQLRRLAMQLTQKKLELQQAVAELEGSKKEGLEPHHLVISLLLSLP